MKLLLSREAARDIEEIGDFTAERWGKRQAVIYIRNLHDAFERLANNPALGHRRFDLPAAFLVYQVASHLVIYRVDDGKDRVEVLNILHPSMDVAKRVATALRRLDQ